MPSTTPSDTSPEDEEFYASYVDPKIPGKILADRHRIYATSTRLSWGLCILCVLLIGALICSYYLQVKRIRAIHETVVSIFAGMVVGLIIRLSPGHLIREMLSFKHTLFFNLLLPPIILNSGYELKQENFFRNFGTILTFAFLGTFISAVGLGVLVYIWSFLGLEGLKFTLLECLIFGSTLSATDPVTILAIFNTYKVDPKLYTIIFGESILNDAVSIVMYETLSQFHGEDIYLSSLFHGIGIFLLSFSISMALGVVFGLMCSLGLKHSNLALYPHIESCIVSLVAYCAYFFSNGLSMSGIVSLLFCGVTLKHYAYHTMSVKTQKTTKYMFAVMSQLSENFIFIYLGLNLFTQDAQVFKPLFIIVTAIAVMASRYAAVFPLSELINWVFHTRGQRHEEIPHSYQMMLFWAGLRGAVGVALAAGITGDNADALRTTILVVVVMTVVIFGGTTARMLEVLGIRVGVEDDDDSSDDDGGWAAHGGNLALAMGPGSRKFAGRHPYGDDYDDGYNSYSGSPLESPYHPSGTFPLDVGRSRTVSGGSRGGPYGAKGRQASTGYSAGSSSDSDDNEPLPNAQDIEQGGGGEEPPSAGMVFRDGQWFTQLDERYLLPLFSNSVASRRHHLKKAGRKSSNYGGDSSPTQTRGPSVDWAHREGQFGDGDSESGKGKGPSRNFSESVTDFFFTRPEGTGSPSGTMSPSLAHPNSAGGGEVPSPMSLAQGSSSHRTRSRTDLRSLAMTQGLQGPGSTTSESGRGTMK